MSITINLKMELKKEVLSLCISVKTKQKHLRQEKNDEKPNHSSIVIL